MLIALKRRIKKKVGHWRQREKNTIFYWLLVHFSFDCVNCMEEVWVVLEESGFDAPIYWILDSQSTYIHAHK